MVIAAWTMEQYLAKEEAPDTLPELIEYLERQIDGAEESQANDQTISRYIRCVEYALRLVEEKRK